MLINEFGFGKDVRSAGFHLYPLSTVSVSKTPAAGGGVVLYLVSLSCLKT
jgi:hypothetical protein